MAASSRMTPALSAFGRRLIKAMNRAGIAVDCSHTGIQTTLDAMDVSERPVVFSHNLTKAICESPRNLTDEQIKRVAEMGGVIGINGFPPFVAKKSGAPRLMTCSNMSTTSRISSASNTLASASTSNTSAIPCKQASKAHYDYFVKTGQWDPKDYPPPPYLLSARLGRPSLLSPI